MFDTSNVQYNADNDTQQPRDEQPVIGRQDTNARQNEQQCTYYYKVYTPICGLFLHKNVNFRAKIRNNYELCIINYELFCTFAPAFCKNNNFFNY